MAGSSSISVFGIRHHGPGSARVLVRALDTLNPSEVSNIDKARANVEDFLAVVLWKLSGEEGAPADSGEESNGMAGAA